MSRSFRIKIQEDPDVLVARAEKVARQAGAEFKGDAHSGSFAGSGVEGQYAVEEDSITVTITRKPMIAPWSLVEDKVKGFFA